MKYKTNKIIGLFNTGKLKVTDLVLVMIVVLHIIILSKLIFFPYPEMFIYSYLTDRGLLPYKHIFDQHFPGLMFFPLNFYSMGLATVERMRFLQYGVVAGVHLLLYLTSKKVIKTKKYLLLPNFLYLVTQPFFEGWVLWIDNFVSIPLLLSYYFIIGQKSKKNIFFSGLFLGISLLFKQVVGPLIIVLGIYLLATEKRISQKLLVWLLGLMIPIGILFIWILNLGIWSDFFYWTFEFNITTFAQMGRKNPDLAGLIKVLPVFGTSLIGCIFLLKDFLISKKENSNLWMIIFFIASLAFVYARFDLVHLQPALVFAVLILTRSFINIKQMNKSIYFVYFSLVLMVFTLSSLKPWVGNRTEFFDRFEDRLSSSVLDNLSDKNSKIFAIGTTPHIYYLTKTLPAGGNFVIQFPWFMVEAQDKILDGLENDPPALVIVDRKATVQGMRLVDYMSEIVDYVDQGYEMVDKIEETEVLIKK